MDEKAGPNSRQPPDQAPMQLRKTSERPIPRRYESLESFLLYLKQCFTYEHVQSLLTTADRVLEIGCGEGYGANILSQVCQEIIGFDIAEDVIAHASSKYSSSRCQFGLYDGHRLPVSECEFDAVVSLQVIEHVEDDANFVREAWRAVKHGGMFIVTTPNRLYRLNPNQKPWNRYHVREYDADGLAEVLTPFSDVRICGVRGNEDIQRIELERAKRIRRVAALDPFNLRRLLPKSVVLPVTDLVRKRIFVRGRVTGRDVAEWQGRYRTSDFYVEDSPRYESLDLMAICRKQGHREG